jgi:predicted unusual protein kinase regulating ubiquinone biosynthesis (AarF/ABC1/UbiB family)
MRFTDRATRFAATTSLAARVYLPYKAITFREKRLGLKDAEDRRIDHHKWSAQHLYELAVRRQGLLIKFGQVIGSRPDLIPDEYIDVLSKLQDQVPSRPYSVIKEAVESELKRSIEDVFATFEETPIASASLAQVHRATLHDGRVVAVKVQYPGIEDIVQTDLANVRFLLRILAAFERNLDFSPIIDEISQTAPMELDFINEGHNAELVAANFDRDDVIIPKIYWEYSTRRLLVMEFLDGIKITDLEGLDRAGIDHQVVAQLVVDAYCEQLYLHGLFHADPHPGNLFVRPGATPDEAPKLIMLDFGLCRKLDDKFRLAYARLVHAMFTNNWPEMVSGFMDLGVRVKNPTDAQVYMELGRAFMDVSRPGTAYADRDLTEEVNQRLNKAIRANPIVEIPREFLLIGRMTGLLSGLGKHLDSRVDVPGTILPYVTAAIEGAS